MVSIIHRRTLFSTAIVVLLSAQLLSMASASDGAVARKAQSDRPDAEEILIKTAGHFQSKAALQWEIRSHPRLRRRGWHRVQIPDGMDVPTALEWYRGFPGVVHAEPNHKIQLTGMFPNDALFDQQWALYGDTEESDIQAASAWTLTTGSRDVIVAVLDSGIDYRHEDLKANIWTNPTPQTEADCRAQEDEEQNCYPEDERGWNFADDKPDPMDNNGHGTHVAGIIGAVGNNATGVSGINWEVQLMPLKFLDRNGTGRISDAVEANYYAVEDGRARIINASYEYRSGSSADQTRLEREAIIHARDQGVLFIAAAGNSGVNVDDVPIYPAAHPVDNIISVMATDRTGRRLRQSNFGHNTIHLAAPGEDILSTWPPAIGCRGAPAEGYCTQTGTSMATPMVAGAAALLWSHDTQLDRADWKLVRERILLTTRQPDPPYPAITGGLLNLHDLLSTDPGTLKPVQPTHLSVAPREDGVFLTWLANSAIATGQEIQRCDRHKMASGICDEGDFFPIEEFIHPEVASYLDVEDAVREGMAFEYRIRATNDLGASPWSRREDFVIPPTAPENIQLQADSNGIKITWQNRSEEAQWFVLERQKDHDAFQEIAKLPPHETHYQDPLGEEVTVRYRVCAGHDATGCSRYAVSDRWEFIPNLHEVTSSSSSSSSDSCLFATVLGSTTVTNGTLAADVVRDFRDQQLQSSRIGRRIVRLYYATSPHALKWVENAPWRRDLASHAATSVAVLLARLTDKDASPWPGSDHSH